MSVNNQNLIIYRFSSLYHILKEIDQDFNFKIIEASDQKKLNNLISNLQNYLIISPKKVSNNNKYLIVDKLPIKFSKLLDNLNIKFLKNKFLDQSKIEIKKYIINLNSRDITDGKVKLKLTEKEINTIIYLLDKKKPVSIRELQIKVWEYQPGMETHTVETHIYRLRKKILKTFNDENLLVSKKNGYQIS